LGAGKELMNWEMIAENVRNELEEKYKE